MKLKRYNITYSTDYGGCSYNLSQEGDGDLVYYDDLVDYLRSKGIELEDLD